MWKFLGQGSNKLLPQQQQCQVLNPAPPGNSLLLCFCFNTVTNYTDIPSRTEDRGSDGGTGGREGRARAGQNGGCELTEAEVGAVMPVAQSFL